MSLRLRSRLYTKVVVGRSHDAFADLLIKCESSEVDTF